MDFDVKKYARLARIKLTPAESKKIDKDLEDILDHFKELEQVDTGKVKPMTGGTSLVNVFREDEAGSDNHKVEGGVDQFPESKDGYLKAPKVFE